MNALFSSTITTTGSAHVLMLVFVRWRASRMGAREGVGMAWGVIREGNTVGEIATQKAEGTGWCGRCGWPELNERPVTFEGGLRVVFSIMGGASASHMMGQQVTYALCVEPTTHLEELLFCLLCLPATHLSLCVVYVRCVRMPYR